MPNITVTFQETVVHNTTTIDEDAVNITVVQKNGKDGADGADGSDANVTSENIATALGYTPADSADVLTPVPSNAVFSDTVYDDTAIQAEVSANTTDRHTHTNKATIDKFGENAQGEPTYNGVKVDTTIAQRDVYDGLDSIDNTISLSANQGKVLNDKIGDINTALDTINGQII